MTAAGFTKDVPPGYVLVLVEPHSSVVMQSQRLDMPARQAETVANVAAAKRLIVDEQDVHVCSAKFEDGKIWTAAVSKSLLEEGLAALRQLSIDPDGIVPLGLILPDVHSGFVQVDIDGDVIVRGQDAIFLAEPSMRTAIIGNDDVETLNELRFEKCLVAAYHNPMLNIRTGAFAKAAGFETWKARFGKVIFWLMAAVIITTFAINIVNYARLQWQIAELEDEIIINSRAAAPSARSSEEAERFLDAKLIAAGVGGRMLTVPLSALLSSMKDMPNAHVRNLNYTSDGALSVVLVGPERSEVKSVVERLAVMGFEVNASYNKGAEGLFLANVKVKAR